MRNNLNFKYLFLIAVLGVLSSCSSTWVGDLIADALSAPGSNTVFNGDDDPQLVADALPFAIKLYESLAEMAPAHSRIRVTVGSLCIMYANAFVALPANKLSDEQFEERSQAIQRAKRLYIRGKDYLFKALDLAYPGFTVAFEKDQLASFLPKIQKDHADMLYWAAAGWFGAASLDSLDATLAIKVPNSVEMMARAYALNPDLNDGAIHDFYTTFYAAMPEGMGRDLAKAEFHFNESLRLNKGKTVGPYLARAESYALAIQDKQMFLDLCNKGLAIDPYADPKNKLVNLIYQDRIRYLISKIDVIFW